MPRATAPRCLTAITAVLTSGAAWLCASPASAAPPAPVERVSVSSASVEANAAALEPAVSADGRFVAFRSAASTLVAGDSNRFDDIFVRDRETEETERVSIGPGGTQANGVSREPAISADGGFVAFTSWAPDLVEEDGNGGDDVFVHDRETGATERVSVGPEGIEANGASTAPAISADGRFVAFQSTASNLVDDDTNGASDIFVHDRETGVTERVSVGPGGAEANDASTEPAISADGRFVAFRSTASNLVDGDTNDRQDIFVHDRETGRTARVSVGPLGIQADGASAEPAISADGRLVAFRSAASNLVDGDATGGIHIYVHDRETGQTERVSTDRRGAPGDRASTAPAISGDGRFVAFTSWATNLVSADSNNAADIFVHDRATGRVERVNIGPSRVQANRNSRDPAINADGSVVAFVSLASNLVAADANNAEDVFVALSEPPVAEADLAVTKACEPARPLAVNELATCTVRVANRGPAAAGEVVLTDLLTYDPEATLRVGALAASQGTCLPKPDAGGDTDASGALMLSCDLGTIARSQAATVSYTVRTLDRPTTVENAVSIESATPDPEPANNEAGESMLFAGPSADVWTTLRLVRAFTKPEPADPQAERTNITYRANVGNSGPDGAENVLLIERLSLPGETVSILEAPGECNTFNPRASTFLCDLGTLSAGEQRTLTIRIQVAKREIDPAQGGAAALTARAVVTHSTPDPRSGNNEVTVTTPTPIADTP